MVVTDSLHSSIATYDLYERTARCKFIGQVDFLSPSVRPYCTLTDGDGARKFRRWRYYRPTGPHLEGPRQVWMHASDDLLFAVVASLPYILSSSNVSTDSTAQSPANSRQKWVGVWLYSRAYFSVQLMTNCAVVTWKCAVVTVILCSFDSDVLHWIFSGIC